MRKPYGVWMLLLDGKPSMFSQERTLGEAMIIARTLRGDLSLFPKYRVFIAAPPQIRRKAR